LPFVLSLGRKPALESMVRFAAQIKYFHQHDSKAVID
jgi:hypothetical protein